LRCEADRKGHGDAEAVSTLAKWMRTTAQIKFAVQSKSEGTAAVVMSNNTVGGFATRNFNEGQFNQAEKISAER